MRTDSRSPVATNGGLDTVWSHDFGGLDSLCFGLTTLEMCPLPATLLAHVYAFATLSPSQKPEHAGGLDAWWEKRRAR